MKKIIFFCLILFTVFIGCYPYKRSGFKYNHYEDAWITNFKDDVFMHCIREGYNNDTIFDLMQKKDLLNSGEIDGWLRVMDLKRTLGKTVAQNIPKPYKKIDDPRDTSKKLILTSCLHYYGSKELDSIARSEYRKKLKSKD